MKKVIRISRAHFDPQMADETIKLLLEMRAVIWPKQEQLTGYIDGYLGVDRQNGTMVWVTVWESLELANALGSLPEMRASNARLTAQGVKFDPRIALNHGMMDSCRGCLFAYCVCLQLTASRYLYLHTSPS